MLPKESRMKRKIVYLLAVTIFLTGLAFYPSNSPVLSINAVYPEMYAAKASRNPVNFGVQPEDRPLILSVCVATGGAMDRVSADLGDLSGARYYDPGSDMMRFAHQDTPLQRVYIIDGEEAYLYKVDDEYEDYQYRTALTHKVIEGKAVRSSKWQVELPNAGYRIGSYELQVRAVNEFSHGTTAKIPLEVVNDWTAPTIDATVQNPVDSSISCPGDSVTIRARVSDDLSGVYLVNLAEGDAASIFGESADTTMRYEPDTNTWSVVNRVPASISPGNYVLRMISIDHAGNRSVSNLTIEIASQRSLFDMHLHQGWNLISVPKALKTPAVEDLFGGSPITHIQTVRESKFYIPDTIEPGWGYLVKSDEEITITLELAQHDPSVLPLMIDLKPGWNLLGYASPTMEPVMPLTFYLGADLKDKWVILYTENGSQARSKSTSPYVWATDSFPTSTGKPSFEHNNNLPVLELGKGYWIYLAQEGQLIP